MAICFIFAHPDDEAFGVAGTMAKLAAQGVRIGLICVTRGEAGQSNGLASTPAELARVRSAELARAALHEGVADIEILDFPDGAAAKWDRAALSADLARLLESLRPEAVVTFDREGITRHPDHIAVSHAVTEIVCEHGRALGVKRLFYQVVTCPEEASPEGPALACVAPDQVDVTVDIRAYETLKRAALRCHRSQSADTAHLLDLPMGSLAAEHYRLAWSGDGWVPPVGRGADLLAGLSASSLEERGSPAIGSAPGKTTGAPLPLILASGSPRRQALLAALGLEFTVHAADLDETPAANERPDQLVCRLSQAKAAAVADHHPEAVVLAADTVVVLDSQILGKPRDPAEAVAMLSALRDHRHEVYTAVTLARAGGQRTRMCCSQVWLRPFDDADIRAYVATGDPLDKAGAYAIQHPVFSPVARWEGCYPAIMGLPLADLAALLAEAGIDVPNDVVTVCESVAGGGNCCLRSRS